MGSTAHVADDFDGLVWVGAVVPNGVAVLDVLELGEDEEGVRSVLLVVAWMSEEVPCTRDRVQWSPILTSIWTEFL